MQDEIIRSFAQKDRDTSKLLTYQRSFALAGRPGSNDEHQVLVFPVRGPSIGSCLKQRPMATRMSAARQLLETLECLHSSGFVHGDLNDRNVMWGIKNDELDRYPIIANNEDVGRPQKKALPEPSTWRPGEMVKPVEVPESFLDDTVYLGDFGLTIRAGIAAEQKGWPPIGYRPPEQLHNFDPSFAGDMWSYMCLFTQLYLGASPFEKFSEVVTILDPLPEEWNSSCSVGLCNNSRHDPNGKPAPIRTLAAWMERAKPEISAEERFHALSIMNRGFAYHPEHRITASELLKDSSFNALMKIHNC